MRNDPSIRSEVSQILATVAHGVSGRQRPTSASPPRHTTAASNRCPLPLANRTVLSLHERCDSDSDRSQQFLVLRRSSSLCRPSSTMTRTETDRRSPTLAPCAACSFHDNQDATLTLILVLRVASLQDNQDATLMLILVLRVASPVVAKTTRTRH